MVSALLAALSIAQPKPVVAVFDLDAKHAQLPRATVSQLDGLVGAELAATNRFTVVPKGEVKKALLDAKKESYRACYDEACQIELGKELAAERTLSGAIARLGKRCVISLRLYDLRTSATTKAATADGACTAEALLESMRSAVRDLAGLPKPLAPAVAAAADTKSKTTPATPAAAPEPDGFRDVKLGAAVDELGPIAAIGPCSNGAEYSQVPCAKWSEEAKCFTRTSDKLTIGDQPIAWIAYCAIDGRVLYIRVQIGSHRIEQQQEPAEVTRVRTLVHQVADAYGVKLTSPQQYHLKYETSTQDYWRTPRILKIHMFEQSFGFEYNHPRWWIYGYFEIVSPALFQDHLEQKNAGKKAAVKSDL